MSNDSVDFSILDGSVDELADLKGFEPIPAGSYKLEINWDEKAINDSPAVILKLKVVEVLELSDSSEVAPELGKSSDIAFILGRKDKQTGKITKNEIGEGQLKQVISVLKDTFEGANIREIMKASEGAVIAATLKVRVDKNDAEKKYNSIKECTLA